MMRTFIFILALCICSQFCAWEVKGDDDVHVPRTLHQDCWEKREVLTSCFFDPQARYICCTQTKRWGLDCSTTVRRPFETSTEPTCTVDDASSSSSSSPSLPVEPPVESPIEPPTDSSVEPPTDSPVEPPTDSPVEPPTDSPVDSLVSGDSPPGTGELPSPSTSPVESQPVPSPSESPVEPPVEAPAVQVKPSPPPTSNNFVIPPHHKVPPPATITCDAWYSKNTSTSCNHGTCKYTRVVKGEMCMDGVAKPYEEHENWTKPDPYYKQSGGVFWPILTSSCQPSSERIAVKMCSRGRCCETVEEQGIKCVHGLKRPYQIAGQPANCYKNV